MSSHWTLYFETLEGRQFYVQKKKKRSFFTKKGMFATGLLWETLILQQGLCINICRFVALMPFKALQTGL